MKRRSIILLSALMVAGWMQAEDVVVDCGGSVQLTAAPKTGYHFVKWNDDNTENPRTVANVKASATYTAYFAIDQYTIVFKNEDGTTLQSETLDYGSAVTYKGSTPTKASTAEFDYTFDSWSPSIDGNTKATADAEYTATFTASKRKYTITFKNEDGTVLQSSEWEYGTTPAYSGNTPTKTSTDEFTYTFKGWDKTISSVTGEETYTATYDNATNTYTITLSAGEGGTVSGGGTQQYGTTMTITATANECYRFKQWNDGSTDPTRTITVEADKTYTAEFELITYTITVTSDDENMGSVSAAKVTNP